MKFKKYLKTHQNHDARLIAKIEMEQEKSNYKYKYAMKQADLQKMKETLSNSVWV